MRRTEEKRLKHNQYMKIWLRKWRKENPRQYKVKYTKQNDTRNYWHPYNINRRKERFELIQRCKMKPCMDCGIQYNPWIMEYDHRDRSTKRIQVSEMYRSSYSLHTVQNEIDKCDVVCANCHKERTHTQRINKEF